MRLIWKCESCEKTSCVVLNEDFVGDVNASRDGKASATLWMQRKKCKYAESFDIIFKASAVVKEEERNAEQF